MFPAALKHRVPWVPVILSYAVHTYMGHFTSPQVYSIDLKNSSSVLSKGPFTVQATQKHAACSLLHQNTVYHGCQSYWAMQCIHIWVILLQLRFIRSISRTALQSCPKDLSLFKPHKNTPHVPCCIKTPCTMGASHIELCSTYIHGSFYFNSDLFDRSQEQLFSRVMKTLPPTGKHWKYFSCPSSPQDKGSISQNYQTD